MYMHLRLQVGWVCQALGCYGLPFSPSIYFTKNGMGKVFFWIFAMFPWNPLTKGVLDMSAAAADATRGGEEQLASRLALQLGPCSLQEW
jgi:hypothetical protein